MRFALVLVAVFLLVVLGGRWLVRWAQHAGTTLPVGFGGRAP